MKKEIVIRVAEAAGNNLCVASEDGQKVYKIIAEALREGHKVRLSFQNVISLTSAFLNAAVGQLYGKFSEEQIRANLQISDILPEDIALLKRVIVTAKAYFKDPARFNMARKEVLGN